MRLTALVALVALASVPSVSAQEPREAPDSLVTPTGTLHATLALPEGDGPFPVVLILAGSGGTDRDGNGGGMRPDTYRLLAQALAERGVATLRTDKRGIGESAGADVDSLTFGLYADDAAAWLRRLQDDGRFSAVVAGGHSEGAHLASLAATDAGADGLVLLAGAAEPLVETLRWQLADRLPETFVGPALAMLDSVEAGRVATGLPPPLDAVFSGANQRYLISTLSYDPVRDFAAFDGPALVVLGSTDLQVLPENAERFRAARPAAEVVVVEGMNHVLRDAAGDLAAQAPSYTSPDLPLTAEAVARVTAFVQAVGRGGR